jgi:integrase
VELNAQAVAVLRSRLKDREAAFRAMERERRACEARIAAKPGKKYKRERNRIKMIPGEAECMRRYVFPSPLRTARSEGLHLGSLRNVVDRLEDAAHLDDFKPHDLRRTYGSYAHGAGVPKEHVGASLGHARGSGATDVYLTAWNSAKAKAADAVGAFMKAQSGGAK